MASPELFLITEFDFSSICSLPDVIDSNSQ